MFKLLLLLFSLLSLSAAASPSPAPSPAPPTSLFSPILSSLGFHFLSSVAAHLSSLPTNTTASWRGPVTIFTPTDSSLATCPSCSVPLFLYEHTLPGLFPLPYLLSLPFGTKVESLSPGRCLTITHSDADVFISGVKITRPDLYNDGHVAVHGLQGYVSHLSPFSCDVHRMTSLSLPVPRHHHHHDSYQQLYWMKLMMKDAMVRLGIGGYAVVALALRVKYGELVGLSSMTVFALDDVAIFSSGGGGHEYVTHFRFHVVPNRLLMAADLAGLPTGTVLPTVDEQRKLVITSAGGPKPATVPVSINYVKIKSPDMVYNHKIVVHGLPTPFHDIGQIGQSGWEESQSDASAAVSSDNNDRMVSPAPAIESTVEIADHHHGL